MTAQPIDFTALARETARLIWKANARDGYVDLAETESLLEEALSVTLTQSHAAGRAEGLEEAAKWPPADLFAEALSLISLTRYGGEATLSADLHAKLTGFLDRAHTKSRALAAADPAPGDQVAPCGIDCERDDGFTCAEDDCAIDSGRVAAPAHPVEPAQEVERLRTFVEALFIGDPQALADIRLHAGIALGLVDAPRPAPKGPRCPFMDAPCDCQDLPDEQKCLGRSGK